MTLRVAAEWEPQCRVWVAAPGSEEHYPGCLAQAQAQHAAFVDALRTVVTVFDVSQFGLDAHEPYLRDTGPMFLVDGHGGKRCATFTFNNWGGKWGDDSVDRALAPAIAEAVHLHSQPIGLTMEGGGIEVDGHGTAMMLEASVLTQTRNPGMSKADVEAKLRETLNLKRFIWLTGTLTGDDTDGHIDNVARFIGKTPGSSNPKVIAPLAPRDHIDHEATARNVHDLHEAGCEVITLPVPEPMFYDYAAGADHQGRTQLSPSYANALISNGHVFVPAFGHDTDAIAANTWAEATNMPAIMIRCEWLLVGGGTLHCLTRDEPV